MNLPNSISLGRIALVPVFVLLYNSGRMWGAALVLLLCGLSDILDGAIARRFGLETELGRILDPVADKLMQAAMMVCAAAKVPQLWLLLLLHALREGSLGALAVYVRRETGTVQSSRWYGKLCSALVYAVLLWLLLVPEPSEALSELMVLICMAAVIACLLLYAADFMQILRASAQRERPEH